MWECIYLHPNLECTIYHSLSARSRSPARNLLSPLKSGVLICFFLSLFQEEQSLRGRTWITSWTEPSCWYVTNHTPLLPHLSTCPSPFQILVFLMVCVIICLIGSLIFEFLYGQSFEDYARYYNSLQDSPAEISFLQILSTIIVLNTFVPISLYVR